MLLAIDVGNTQTVFGLFDGDRARRSSSASAPTARTRATSSPSCCARSSTSSARRDRPLLVGAAARARVRGVRRALGRRRAARARPGRLDRRADPLRRPARGRARTGSRTPSPRASATARRRSSSTSAPRRTSTSSPRPASSRAACSRPGIEVSMDALFARAARLPKVPFVAPERVISQTTTAALQSGLVYGFAGQVDAIVDAHPRRARRARRAGRRDRRPRRPDRAALADDHRGRPGADAARARGSSGSEPTRGTWLARDGNDGSELRRRPPG